MVGLIRRNPVWTEDGRYVDFAASFNRLPRAERRESELVGFLGALRVRDDGDFVNWNCVSLNGRERVWRTRPVLATERTIDDIMQEG